MNKTGNNRSEKALRGLFLMENLVYTGKRRSFKVTPGKLEELRVSLVEMRETPAKGGETPEKRGEPHVVQPFDDVERIGANLSVGKILFGNGNKAVVHAAAEVFDLPALFQRKLIEISVYGRAGDLLQDVNDGVDIAVGDAALILAEPPFMVSGTPDTAVSFEFIDADGFREFPGVSGADQSAPSQRQTEQWMS